MGDNCGVAIALSQFYGAEGFGERADLVYFHQDGVGATGFDTFLEVFNVGYEQVVAYELATVADEVGENLPAFPVVFGHAVFDGVDGELFNQAFEVFGLFSAGAFGSAFAFFPSVVVNAVFVEFGRSAVEADGNVLTGHVAGEFDSLDDYLESIFGAVEGGSETAFVANGGGEVTFFEHLLEVVEYFGTHADAFLEGGSADGTNHEFLEADGSIGVSAAVDDVHHGHGQSAGVATADVFVEGEVEVVGSSLSNCERHTEDGVCTKVALGIGAIQCKHSFIDCDLIEGAHTHEGLCDGAVYVSHSFGNTLAHVASFVTVAKFESLVYAGRCTGGYRCTAFGAGFENYVNFHGRVATRIEHFTTNNFFNFHSYSLLDEKYDCFYCFLLAFCSPFWSLPYPFANR